ncbi:hypothetical protein HPP92_025048 [Vanilla planifolia]|uniref:Polygalacturonase n=1 Tax=Vanilla planifolia TaxID=51239 RepID=A0A835U8M9_VANPL|nr:hypothetical protein HPP92_025048 [Vanilla planifolia]
MEGERSSQIRRRAAEWREASRRAVDAGGSSDRNVVEFLERCCKPAGGRKRAVTRRLGSRKTMIGLNKEVATPTTQAFLRAWAAACSSTSPASVYVPPGRFPIGHLHLTGPCRSTSITLHIAGTLSSSAAYPYSGGSPDWILLDGVERVSLLGGTLDGRGSALWACKASQGGRRCPAGATNLRVRKSKEVVISGLTSGSEGGGLRISAAANGPNTDGLHVEKSEGITVTTAVIGTGDDCVSVGPGTANLWLERITCGPGHGISIGSLGKRFKEAGVENVTVRWAVFKSTQNGLRIKTWAKPSGGFVRRVVFDHAIMHNVHNPLIIDQNYCPHNRGCPAKGANSGVSISEVQYSDIRGSSATAVAMSFDCSRRAPCRGIELRDIRLTYNDEGQVVLQQCWRKGVWNR